MRVRLTSKAKSDLASITDWIARDNPRRALSYTKELHQACLGIARNPRAFARAPELENGNFRRRVFGVHLIFYRIENDQIEIVRILHGAQEQTELGS